MGIGIVDSFKHGIAAMVSPGSETKKSMDLGKAFEFYYKASIISFILFLVVAFVLTSTNAFGLAFHSSVVYSLMKSANLDLYLLGFALVFWIAVPISMLVNAFIYQLVGKHLLGEWKGVYDKTLTAVMFGQLPAMLFAWVFLIPAVSIFYMFVFTIWNMVVFIVALSAQQRVSRVHAFVTAGLTTILVYFLVYGFFFSVGFAFLSGGGAALLPWHMMNPAMW
jgi:hypothetical protein